MNLFEFYEIVERFHTFQNPTSEAKLDRLIEYCAIGDGQRILDIGCGKAWLLRRIIRKYSTVCVGIDRHGSFLEDARQALAKQTLVGSVELRHHDAAEFAGPERSFDVALCIGASFAIGTFEELLAWLRRFVKPGGMMAVGDIYARSAYARSAYARSAYARSAAMPEQSARHFSGGALRSLADTCEMLNRDGLRFTALVDSTLDDWDRYESLHWIAAEHWLRGNTDHPDYEEFRRKSEAAKLDHIHFDRDSLGWAMFVCRVE